MRRRLIVIGFVMLISIAGFIVFNAVSDSRPVLVFEDYEQSRSNGTLFATFELRNSCRKSIWLLFSGEHYPLNPPFLERPMTAPPNATNVIATNLYSIRVGSFFMQGQRLQPGESLSLKWLLAPGNNPEQVGVYYYLGNFKDGNDFISKAGTPLLESNSSSKARFNFLWQDFKRRFSAPKYREVWCPQRVLFQDAKATNSPE